MDFAASKISWLHEISVILLLTALGSSFKIFGGWFQCLLMQTVSLFRFRYGWYVLFNKPKRTSRKSPVFKFVLTVMLSPQLLKIWIICFLLRSISGPEEFGNVPRCLYIDFEYI